MISARRGWSRKIFRYIFGAKKHTDLAVEKILMKYQQQCFQWGSVTGREFLGGNFFRARVTGGEFFRNSLPDFRKSRIWRLLNSILVFQRRRRKFFAFYTRFTFGKCDFNTKKCLRTWNLGGNFPDPLRDWEGISGGFLSAHHDCLPPPDLK